MRPFALALFFAPVCSCAAILGIDDGIPREAGVKDSPAATDAPPELVPAPVTGVSALADENVDEAMASTAAVNRTAPRRKVVGTRRTSPKRSISRV